MRGARERRGGQTIDLGIAEFDDRALVERAAGGDNRAFEELYRRHAPAAQRVGYSITGNADDASDAVAEAFTRILAGLPSGRLLDASAFRPYLMAATRNAAIDHLRRKGRLQPTDVAALDRPSTGAGPPERILLGEDNSMVVQAFRDLPERWRSVLWLTEIEGIPPREVGELLGLSANGASQLAVRARAGLRDRFLQAHVREAAEREACRYTLSHLGAYVGGGLAARDIAKVDQHLAGCERCQRAKEELEELSPGLRRAILPIPLILGGVAIGNWAREALGTSAATAAGGAAAGGAALAGGAAGGLRSSLGAAHKALAAACAGVLAAGVISASTVNPGGDGTDVASRPRAAATGQAAPQQEVARADEQPPAVVEGVVLERFGGRLPSKRGAEIPTDVGPGVLPVERPRGSGGDDTGGGSGGGGGDQPAPPGGPTPVVQAGAGGRFGGGAGSVGAGVGDGGCTGVAVGSVSAGCAPAPPATDGLSVTTGGEALPPRKVTLP